MSRVRNGVVIIILCIIGGYSLYRRNAPANLGLPTPAPEVFKDAVAATPAPRHKKKTKLVLAPSQGEDLRDAVAQSPALPAGAGAPPPSNHPPRGSGEGGFSPNGRQDLPPGHNTGTTNLSPSGPPQFQE